MYSAELTTLFVYNSPNIKSKQFHNLSKTWKFHTGKEDIVRLLVEHGAEFNAVNINNDSTLILALNNGKLFYVII